MSIALFLRADLFKGKGGTEEGKRGAPRQRGAAFDSHEVDIEGPPDPMRPKHKPAVSSEHRPSGFSAAPIHASGETSPDPGSVGKVPAGEASGITESRIKVHPKGKRRTGVATSGEEMEYARSTHNKPSYKCVGEGCRWTVHPSHDVKVRRESELLSHVKRGGKFIGTKEGQHLVEHAPSIEDKETMDVASVPHESLKPEHIQAKLCPSCFSKKQRSTEVARATGKNPDEAKAKVAAVEAKLNRSFSMISDLFSFSKSLAEGEDFGKPAATVSEEISHLVRDKDYSQKRAVAAAMDMQRRGEIKEKSLYLAL